MTDRSPWHQKYKVSIPEDSIGDWTIEHHTVEPSEAAFGRMRACNPSSGGRFVPEGTYTGLKHKGILWMSDTPDEIRDHIAPIHEAQRRGGHILINGLGIGMVTAAVLDMTDDEGNFVVEKVTVIELSSEVIYLVGRILQERYGDRLEIIEADSYEFRPPKGIRYSMVWHDIWLDLCTDNLQEMAKLHRKYGRRTDWQGSWGKELLQSQRRRERNQGW
jgi:hypothetical protein